MSLSTATTASVTLNVHELKELEDILQRDAVHLLATSTGTTQDTLGSVAYRRNRELFSKVWDALYDPKGA